MKSTPRVKVRRWRRISPIWIVPAVTLIIGLFILYREYVQRGPLITITFSEGSGLEPDRTVITYRGVAVGTVEEVGLSEDLDEVLVVARLLRSAAAVAREGSEFWIVRPRIGPGGVTGLNTLLEGPHIEVEPGEGAPTLHFQGLVERPMNVRGPSTVFLLRAEQKGTIQRGVPVLYRQLEVGRVESVELARDATHVLVGIRIDEPYDSLVRDGTVFWDSGGVRLQVGLFGASFQAGPLESILSGAVAFATPPEAAEREPVPPETVFELEMGFDDDWLEWKPTLPLPSSPKAAPPEPEESRPGESMLPL